MMGSCRNMFQEPYFPAWIFPLSHPLAEVAAEIQGIRIDSSNPLLPFPRNVHRWIIHGIKQMSRSIMP